MQLIDTHAHLYLEEFEPEQGEMLARALDAGVKRIYLPAINSQEHQRMMELADKSANCLAMMGLHPCYVKENFKEELALVADWLSKRSFAAIGEIGLDFYWDRSFEAAQGEAFRYQMELAVNYGLPISIHSREATRECIDLVREIPTGKISGVFHCFSGDYELAKAVVDTGFYLGVGGVVTYKNASLPEVLGKIGLDRIVLETDAPYLSPVPFRGKRNESSYLPLVAGKLAGIFGVEIDEVARITTANALELFKSTSL